MKLTTYFNSIRFQIFGTVFLFLGSLVFTSCNDGAPFGMEIQPEDELIGVYKTTNFSISAETIIDTTTFITSGSAVQLLGFVNDPQFGTVEAIKEGTFTNLNKLAIQYSDAVVQVSEEVNKDILDFVNSTSTKFVPFVNEEQQVEEYSKLYDEITEDSSVLAD